MTPRVFIDGHAGTTGLRIHEGLAGRCDLELVALPEARRKDPATRVIDTSTERRVAEGWTYGLPELAPGQRDTIARARRVANPGCYATGVILLLRPLVDAGWLPADAPVTVHALSGYTGGGKSMIGKWEDPARDLLSLRFEAPSARARVHKPVPEMRRFTRRAREPQFVPAVGP